MRQRRAEEDQGGTDQHSQRAQNVGLLWSLDFQVRDAEPAKLVQVFRDWDPPKSGLSQVETLQNQVSPQSGAFEIGSLQNRDPPKSRPSQIGTFSNQEHF